MALQFQVETLDTIPEAVRALYKEDGGKFRLDLDGYEDPQGLKSALQKERDAAKAAQRQVSAWDKLGKTPDEISAMLEAQSKAEGEKLGKSGDWEKVKQQMVEQHAKELAKRDDGLQAKDKAIERYLIDAQATAAIAEAKGAAALLLPRVKAHVKVMQEDGGFVARVVDAEGNPRVDSKGKFLTINDLVSEMRQSETYARAFDASGASGSGAGSSSGAATAKTVTRSKWDTMSHIERSSFSRAGGKVTD